MMSTNVLAAVVVLVCMCTVSVAFQSSSSSWSYTSQNRRELKVKPLYENFFFDVAEDPAVNTPRQIFGEVALKGFVEDYDPNALLLGGPKYDLLGRVRELKLLSQTADSGLLELLEEKGLTLSQAEKLLPLADSFNLLPLLLRNKNLLLSAAPLLVEPAPALLPVVVGVLKTPPQNYIIPASLLLGTGLYEVITDNALLGGVEVLLGLPLFVLGTVLTAKINVPTVAAVVDDEIKVSSKRPMAKKRAFDQPTAAPKASGRPAAAKKSSSTVKVGKAPARKAAPKAEAVYAAPKPAALNYIGGIINPSGGNGSRKVIRLSSQSPP